MDKLSCINTGRGLVARGSDAVNQKSKVLSTLPIKGLKEGRNPSWRNGIYYLTSLHVTTA